MEKFQTFHDVKEVENYFDTGDKTYLAEVLSNKSVISEGFFRDLDGKDRITKNITLSETYRIKEDKLKDYTTTNPLYTTDQLTSLKTKLWRFRSQIETYGKVYRERGACGIFGTCCSYFEIYEVKYLDADGKINTIIWTSLIHDKILKKISEGIKFSNPHFFDTISTIFDNKNLILIPEKKTATSRYKFSYAVLLKQLNDLDTRDNPLFYSEESISEIQVSYQSKSETRYTNRQLQMCKLKKENYDEHIIDIIGFGDLLVGITSPEIENIEYVYFFGFDAVKLPKHSEILYTKEKMPYIPISTLPLILSAMVYVYPKQVHIKFKHGKTPGQIFAYYQNVHDRDDLLKHTHQFRDGDFIIRIEGGGIGVTN